MRSITIAVLAGMLLVLGAISSALAQDDSEQEPASKAAAEQAAASNEAQGRAKRGEKTAAAKPEEEKPAEQELICRREQVTGSHRRVRRCYTPEQLRSVRQESQRVMRERLNRRPVGTAQ